MHSPQRRSAAPPRPAWRRATAWLVLVVFQLAPPGLPAAFAGPEGEHVVYGSAEISREGNETDIRTETSQTIIDWTGGFGIGANETVNIYQPDELSKTLNRDRSPDPTPIFGKLWSNGEVWIVNPWGVYVDGNAVLDVGKLVAAAGNVANEDFLAGVDHFTDLRGSVEVGPGARIAAADSVLLVGRNVANYGTITAGDGMIALVAGDEVRLARLGGHVVVHAENAATPDPERWGVRQAGTLDAGRGAVSLTAGDAYSLAMNHTGITRAGEITVDGGGGGLTEVAGTLDASSDAPGEEGGRIQVLGDRVALLDATLDASGDAGGGEILVGGDLQGQGDTRTARRTFVSDQAELLADAGRQGDGGKIIVWADEATSFSGTLSARGGAEGGDGGFAEISGKRSLTSHGDIDLGADAGESGTLLYDPLRIEIVGGTGESVDDSDAAQDQLTGDGGALGQVLFGDVGDEVEPFRIYVSEIEGTDANIVLQADRSVATSGTFDKDDVVIKPGNDLTIAVAGGVPAPDPSDPDDVFGIDLDGTPTQPLDLTWKVSDGGRVVLTTNATEEQIADGDIPVIEVHAIDAQGGVRQGETGPKVQITANGAGNIDVAKIDTSGALRTTDDGLVDAVNGATLVEQQGGSVSLTSNAGAIRVGEIAARGGNAGSVDDHPGDGGTGGNVTITNRQGSIDVGSIDKAGSIDTSGGAGVLYVDDEDTVQGGTGGQAGRISLIADLDVNGEGGSDALPSPIDPLITVRGELAARGGNGTGTGSIPDPDDPGEMLDVGADGGRGGSIYLSAGLRAEKGGIVLESGAALDASGGDGTAAGGDAAADFLTADLTLHAVALESHGDIASNGASIVARGGNADTDPDPGGAGGAGGNVSFQSTNGVVEVPNVDTSGGRGVGEPGGAGGAIEAEAGTLLDDDGNPDAGGFRNLQVSGAVVTLGGAGDDADSVGRAGTVSLTTQGALESGPDATEALVRAGRVAIEADSIGRPSGSDPILLLWGAGDLDEAGAEDTVQATVAGDVLLRLAEDDSGEADRFDRVSLTQTDVKAGSVVVLRENGTETILDAGKDLADETRHVVRELTAQDGDAHFTYRLADFVPESEDSGTPLLDELTLAVDLGAVDVQDGAKGVKLANAREGSAPGEEELLGRIEGNGVGTHVTTAGGVELVGTSVGNVDPAQKLGVDGVASTEGSGVELSVAGDVDLAVTGTLGILDIQQRDASGDVDVALPDGDSVQINDDASRLEPAQVVTVDTRASGTAFYYSLEDPTAAGEPTLTLASDTVKLKLGADAGFASTGDLLLDSATDAPAIDAGGHQVMLVADSNFDGGGALRGSGTVVDVDNVGALVAFAGQGVGSEAAPLRLSATGGDAFVEVAGSGGNGGFHLADESANGTGGLRVAPIEFTFLNESAMEKASFRGLDAGGDLSLSFAEAAPDRVIVLGAIQPDEGEDYGGPFERLLDAPGLGVTGTELADRGELRFGFGGIGTALSNTQTSTDDTVPHAVTGGSQRYGGHLLLDNARTYQPVDPETGDPVGDPVALHEVRLQAGGDVVFEGDVDTFGGAPAATLQIDSGGAARFREDVGQAGNFEALVTNAARFEEQSSVGHLVRLQRADFRGTVDGPDALVIRAVAGAPEEESSVTFRGDLGTASPLASLDVDADQIVFGIVGGGAGPVVSSADRLVAGAGGVALNTDTPHAADDVPLRATISDTYGGLSIETPGALSLGAREKLSVTGDLAIRAGGGVTVGDLSADRISIGAPDILIQGRAPAAVELADGSSTMDTDTGVDWVANSIRTSVTPHWDGVEAPPVFALGSGNIDVAGRLPFNVIRFRRDGSAVEPSSFAGPNGLLDLFGEGPGVYADPIADVPRPAPGVVPALEARPSQTAPAAAAPVPEEQVIAFLRSGAAPAAPGGSVAGDTVFATERMGEIARGYRELVQSPGGRSQLLAAFGALERDYPGLAGPEPVDGGSLYRFLASERPASPALEHLRRLATILAEVELLGLVPDESARLRAAIAADFAAASGQPGLDVDAVLAAARASRIGEIR